MCNHHNLPDRVNAKRRAKPSQDWTHELYVRAIWRTAIKTPSGLTQEDRAKLSSLKLTYGAGPHGARGVTYYNRWKLPRAGEPVPLVVVSALHQRDHVQVCGTTLHELAHVIAGYQAGHEQGWKDACTRIGLIDVAAAGTEYSWANFTPSLQQALRSIPMPRDGSPIQPIEGTAIGPYGAPITAAQIKPRPCSAGIGTKGGLSRGKGSGSRMLLYMCSGNCRIRHAGLDLDAHCKRHDSPFVLQSSSLPPAHQNGGAAGMHGGSRVKGTQSSKGGSVRAGKLSSPHAKRGAKAPAGAKGGSRVPKGKGAGLVTESKRRIIQAATAYQAPLDPPKGTVPSGPDPLIPF